MLGSLPLPPAPAAWDQASGIYRRLAARGRRMLRPPKPPLLAIAILLASVYINRTLNSSPVQQYGHGLLGRTVRPEIGDGRWVTGGRRPRNLRRSAAA